MRHPLSKKSKREFFYGDLRPGDVWISEDSWWLVLCVLIDKDEIRWFCLYDPTILVRFATTSQLTSHLGDEASVMRDGTVICAEGCWVC